MRTTTLKLTRNAGVTALIAVIAACGSSEEGGAPEGAEDGAKEGANGGDTAVFSPAAVADCASKGKPKTTLTGKVYDPAGANALYNVMVYVPSGAAANGEVVLPPLKDSSKEPSGIACETCANVIVNPVASALTDGTGTFKLEGVPVGKNVPLVVQVGKWRRFIPVDVTEECADNTVADKTLRLPKNSQEGDLPQIAVTSGYADALECFLRGVGIDEKEFVQGHAGDGHVHLFKGYGGGMGTPAKDFWNDAAQLKKYDLVLLSCEGAEHNELKGGGGLFGGSADDARGSMRDYLNAGGKVFATHYHYTWFKNSPLDAFRNLADWTLGGNTTGVVSFDVNQSFPKGAKFAEWLAASGISNTPGKIELEGVTNSLVSAKPPTTTWIQGDAGAKYFSFNTPLDAAPEQQCGRAVFSDVHSASEVGAQQSTSPTSLDKCTVTSGSLNNKQKALEFLFFDLSACVSDERVAPKAPR